VRETLNPLKHQPTTFNLYLYLYLNQRLAGKKQAGRKEKSTARRAVRACPKPQWDGRGWKAGKARKIKAEETL
jgi:hypothetical protein